MSFNPTTSQPLNHFIQNPSLQEDSERPSWRVIHLPYPRETEEYSCLGIKWITRWKMKLPKIFIQRKILEKRGASVNHDLLCHQLESLLNQDTLKDYDLFSITATHSGLFSMTHTPAHPQHQFLKTRSTSSTLQGNETLIVILKRKK